MQKLRLLVLLLCLWKTAAPMAGAQARLVADMGNLALADQHNGEAAAPLLEAVAEDAVADECPVCWRAYDNELRLKVMIPCHTHNAAAQDHPCCFSCLQSWLGVRNNRTCPSCRTAVWNNFRVGIAAGLPVIRPWMLLYNLSRGDQARNAQDVAALQGELQPYIGPFDDYPVADGLLGPAQLKQRVYIAEGLLRRAHTEHVASLGLRIAGNVIRKLPEIGNRGLGSRLTIALFYFVVNCPGLPQSDHGQFRQLFADLMPLLGQCLVDVPVADVPGLLKDLKLALESPRRNVDGKVMRYAKAFLSCSWRDISVLVGKLLNLLKDNRVEQVDKSYILEVLSYLIGRDGIEFGEGKLFELVDCFLQLRGHVHVVGWSFLLIGRVILQRDCVLSRQMVSHLVENIASARGVCPCQHGSCLTIWKEYLVRALIARGYLKNNPSLAKELLAVMTGRHAMCASAHVAPYASDVLLLTDEYDFFAGAGSVEDIIKIAAHEYATPNRFEQGDKVAKRLIAQDESIAYRSEVIKRLLELSTDETINAEERVGFLKVLTVVFIKMGIAYRRCDQVLKNEVVQTLVEIINQHCGSHDQLVAGVVSALQVVYDYTSEHVRQIFDECIVGNLEGIVRAVLRVHGNSLLGDVLWTLLAGGRHSFCGAWDASSMVQALCERAGSIHDEEVLVGVMAALAYLVVSEIGTPFWRGPAFSFSRESLRALRTLADQSSGEERGEPLRAAAQGLHEALGQHSRCGCVVL